jgi:signal transduction histidine kinase
VWVTSIPLSAQQYLDKDSLWKEYERSPADTSRVLLLIQLGQQYENNNPDSALLLYEEALALSRELNYTPGIIKFYTNATYVYNLLGRYDTSLILNLQSVEIARAYGKQERLAACLTNVGSSYLYLKNYESAIEYTLKAVEILNELGHDEQLSILLGNLSIIYRETGQLEKAYTYARRSLRRARESEIIYSIVVSLNNLGTVYNDLNQPDSTILVLNEAIDLAKATDNKWAWLNADLNLVEAYTRKADYIRVKQCLDEVMSLSEEVADQESIVIAHRGYSIYYAYTGNVGLARSSAMKSLEMAKQNEYTYHVQRALVQLAKVALLEGDYRGSERYTFEADSLQQIIFNEEVASKVQALELQFESRRQQGQIAHLEQQADKNQLILVTLSGALVLALLVAILIFRTSQQKKKILERDALLQQSRIEQLEKEKQLMASEYIIKAQEDERTRMAKDLHDGLGGMLSGVKFSLTHMRSQAILDSDATLVFERALDMLDHSILELRRVAHNMMPEVLVNFGLAEAVRSYCEGISKASLLEIDFQTFGLNDRLPRETEIQVYRIIQELLSNVLRHAKAKRAVVQLSRHDDELLITVEDDGVGFDPNLLSDANSAGLANIRNRLNYLNGKLAIHTAPGRGTSIEINIKVQ